MRRRRTSTGCTGSTAPIWGACRTRTSRSSWGRPDRSTRRRWPRASSSDGRGGYCFELNTLLAALLRAFGFVVTHHQAVVAGEGPVNHMALLVHLDGERWLADAGLGEGFLEPLPFREGATTIGPFDYTLEREDGGSWWMGQHEWGSFSGFRMTEEESAVRPSSPTTGGSRPIPSRASCRPWSSSGRAVGPDRDLRARTLSSVGPSVDEKRVRRAGGVRRGAARRVRDHRRRRAAGAAVGAGRRAARGVPGPRLMPVATHPGNFHADDVFAVAVLGLVHGPLEVVRTRDEAAVAAADVRVDIGWRSDPAAGDFDHHQRGGAGERANGIRYACFGLVWRAFGARWRAGRAEAIDERLVQGVDANDTGQKISTALDRGHPPDVGQRRDRGHERGLGRGADAADEDARFGEAVALATRHPRARAARRRAPTGGRCRWCEAAIGRSGDPRIVELDRKLPWHETVVTTAPEALYVIYPKSDGWGMQAVPDELGEFENRKDLPAEWAGLSGEELAAVTGVADAVFAHSKRFYASAGSREGILALAAQALDGLTSLRTWLRPAPLRLRTRPRRRPTARGLVGRRHERVDRRQVRAHALGHALEHAARGLDPARRVGQVQLDPPHVLHRAQRPLDLGAQRRRVQPFDAALGHQHPRPGERVGDLQRQRDPSSGS